MYLQLCEELTYIKKKRVSEQLISSLTRFKDFIVSRFLRLGFC